MIQNCTTYRVLELFFMFPSKRFYLREICRITKLGMPSVKAHISKLEKEEFIEKIEEGIYPMYKAVKNERFKLYKKTNILMKLSETGFLEFLEKEFTPNAIVLFGSASRGEDVEESDLDLLVIAKEKRVELKRFEKAINRKIHILFESSIKNIPKELLNNIINGIVLYGYLKVL